RRHAPLPSTLARLDAYAKPNLPSPHLGRRAPGTKKPEDHASPEAADLGPNLSSALRRQRLDQGIPNGWMRRRSTTYRESGVTYIQPAESGQHLLTTRREI